MMLVIASQGSQNNRRTRHDKTKERRQRRVWDLQTNLAHIHKYSRKHIQTNLQISHPQ